MRRAMPCATCRYNAVHLLYSLQENVATSTRSTIALWCSNLDCATEHISVNCAVGLVLTPDYDERPLSPSCRSADRQYTNYRDFYVAACVCNLATTKSCALIGRIKAAS